jgi:hypothetical protein
MRYDVEGGEMMRAIVLALALMGCDSRSAPPSPISEEELALHPACGVRRVGDVRCVVCTDDRSRFYARVAVAVSCDWTAK